MQADAQRLGGLLLLPGRCMVIEQALAHLVERAKASGLVARSLARHGIEAALVAPAA